MAFSCFLNSERVESRANLFSALLGYLMEFSSSLTFSFLVRLASAISLDSCFCSLVQCVKVITFALAEPDCTGPLVEDTDQFSNLGSITSSGIGFEGAEDECTTGRWLETSLSGYG